MLPLKSMLVAELKVALRVLPKLLSWTVKLKFKSRDPRRAISFYDAPSVCVVLVAKKDARETLGSRGQRRIFFAVETEQALIRCGKV